MSPVCEDLGQIELKTGEAYTIVVKGDRDAIGDYGFTLLRRNLDREGRSSEMNDLGSLSAAGHVVNEGAIDVGAADTDGIEERVCICHKILLVGELIRNDLGIANVAEHH